MTEVYKIGVQLTMAGNFGQVLGVIVKQLGIADQKTAKLVGSMSKLKLAVTGAFAGFAADKLLSGLTGIVNKTADLSHELTQIAKLGQNANDVARANSAAIDVTRRIRGITQTGALEIYGQLFSLVGQKDALELLPLLSKFDVVMGNTTENFSGSGSGSRALVRAAEQMGRLTDPLTKDVDLNRFKHFLDLATKIGDVTHGAVNSETWLQLAKQGGPALMGMNDRSLGTMAILSQYMGGPRAGTSMMSMFQQMAGGMMRPASATALQELGLLGKDEWKSTPGGGVIVERQARERLAKTFQDPLDAVINKLLPAMQAKGFVTPEQQIQELFSVMGRQTTQRAIADISRNWGQMLRELGRMDAAPGLDQAYGLANAGDVKQNLSNLTTSWQNFWYAVAGPNSENEIGVLKSLTGFIGDMTRAVQGLNPSVVKAVGEGLVALFSGLAIFAGGALLSVVVGLGAVPAAIAAVVVALGTLVAMNWSAIKDGINWVGDAIKGLWEKLKGFLGGDSGIPNVPSPLNYTGGGRFMPISYTSSSVGLGGSASTGGGATGSLGGSASTGGGAGAGVGTRVPGITSPMGGNAATGAGDSVPVPQGILAGAAALLRQGGSSGQLQHFMAANGYPKSGNWCGEFAASVVRAAGGTPPSGAAVASNWRRWGQAVTGLPQIGDIAVRNGVATGNTGSHVGFVVGVDPAHGSFQLEGGNQGPAIITQRLGRYSFRHGGMGSGAVPPPKQSEIHLHNKTILDGRVVAENTMKHMANGGNKAASGGRTYDRAYTRPISI